MGYICIAGTRGVASLPTPVVTIDGHFFNPHQCLATPAGLVEGSELLNANASSFSFMVLVTDGEHNGFGDPVATAEEIRADNTTAIFAVGVPVGVCVREKSF